MSEENEAYADSPIQFSKNAEQSFRQAAQIATEMASPHIGTEHLLLGILSQEESTGGRILKRAGVTFDRVHLALNHSNYQSRSEQSKAQVRRLNAVAKSTIKKSQGYARDFNQDVCGTEHVLLSMLSHNQARAIEILTDMNIPIKELRDQITNFLNQQIGEPTIIDSFQVRGDIGSELARELYQKLRQATMIDSRRRSKTSALDHFSTDLTEMARKKKLDPVIGRQQQIARTITILNRRQKNNPVLIGEPGVGKTAIVEGLAQKIVAEDVPDSLLQKRIVTLDLASMIAGTKYRGEFEDRFRRVLNELTKNKQTIIFIDEIHLLVGAGAAEGAIDASNMLKPALARGNIQVVGATTINEYNKHIEKDAALERRLQPIIVPGTTKTETLAILRGLAPAYAKHHQIKIPDETLEKTVYLADRYLNDRFMPDKAIDLLDEAAAHLRVEKAKVNPVERRLWRQIRSLTIEIDQLAEAQDYAQAAQRKKQLAQLETELKAVKAKTKPTPTPVLTANHLAAVVAVWTGIPANQVIRSEAQALLGLESRLQKSIIGQSEAVTAVATAIRRARSGVNNPDRPIGSFLFLGPTGVGKTELARVLAADFYGRDDALIKIDMSEFAERHTVARLIGAPAGYLGFDHPGQLTEKVRRQPYSLVLFDEIEKAHPDVFNLLLQIMEDGVLTDAKGRSVNFTSTIIILTSNLGANQLQKDISFGFEQIKSTDKQRLDDFNKKNKTKIHSELKKFMKPELINRLDQTIVFSALTPANISQIVKLQIEKLKDRLQEQDVTIVVSTKIKKWLASKGYDRKNGVRPLRRLIQDNIENAIADYLLRTGPSGNHVIRLELEKNKIKATNYNEKDST